MKNMQIEHILEKYFEGETTLAEEQWLKSQMKRQDLPVSLQKYQSLFQFYDQQAAINRPDPQSKTGWKKPIQKRLWIWIGSAVAVISLIFMLIKLTDQKSVQESAPAFTYEDTYETPEEAYEQTQKILSFLSTKLKSGDKHKAKIARVKTLTTLIKVPQE